MKLYLDLCLYYRPFDDQSNERIKLETNILLIFLEWIAAGRASLLNSFALEFENSKNPNLEKRYKVTGLLKYATEYIAFDEIILARSLTLEKYGLMSMDALHIACAEFANADFFITCDDKMVKRAQRQKNIGIACYDALNFVYKELFNL